MSTEKSENVTETTSAAPEFMESYRDCAVFLTAKDVRAGVLSATPPVSADQISPTRGASTRRYTSLAHRIVPILPILALVSGICWALTLLFGFDWDIGHVQVGCIWFYAMLLPLVLGFVLTGVLAVVGRRVRQYRLPTVGTPETFAALFAAALLGFDCLREIYIHATTPPVLTASTAAAVVLPNLALPAALLMLCCVVYLLLTGLGKGRIALAWCAMGAAAGCMLVLFRDYFDFTLPLNSPLRYMSALSIMALLLFFIAEARMHTDLWYATVPFSVCAYSLTLLLTGSISLGQSILACTGSSAFSLLHNFALIATAVFSFFRLLSLTFLLGDHMPPPPSADEIRKSQRKRTVRQ